MKHQYDKSEIVQTEDFCLDDYVNRDLYRQAKRKEKTDKLANDRLKLRQICIDSCFIEICELVDYVSLHESDLLESLFSEFYAWKSFIDSRSKLERLHTKQQQEIDRLTKEVQWYSNQLSEYRDNYKALKDLDLELRKYVCELGGQSQLEIIDRGMNTWERLPTD